MFKKILFTLFLVTVCSSSFAQEQSFESWVTGVKRQARAQGVSQKTLDEAFGRAAYLPKVVALDKKQPEGKMTFVQYRKRIVNPIRIKKGRELYRKHRALLNRVSAKYGVQPQYIVALWGIETNYGTNTGGFGVVSSLATLAYDGRRREFFTKELINALKIIDNGHISAAGMRGSWAGAMGQNQFMPSSFNAYAVDGNGDGKRDIWGTLPDVFSSSSNYLKKRGWNNGERWGRAVKLPANFSKNLEGRKIKKSIAQWSKMGVTLPNGAAVPSGDMQASIVAPDGVNGPAYIIYNNFRVIMRWNASTYFATSVGLLADAIAQ